MKLNMKAKGAVAALLVIGVIFAAGCAARGNNNNLLSSSHPNVASSHPGSIPGTVSGAMNDLYSDVERNISSALDRDERYESGYESRYDYDESGISHWDNSRYESGISGFESYPSRAAMSTDFEQIGALDNEKKAWGPGLNVDKSNRPTGATAYQATYGEYGAYFIAPNSNKIYLTFDEGYENGYTGDILDTLKEKGVKAVFFITYDFAKTQAALVKRMVDEGHILGNHTRKHKSLPDLTTEEIVNDVMDLHDYVKANYGYTMTLFRPPMGEFSVRTLAILNALGYKSVFWSFAYQDWDPDNQPLTIKALDTITSRCHPGSIYLLHAVSKTNSEILGEAIDLIRAKGYEFTRWDWA